MAPWIIFGVSARHIYWTAMVMQSLPRTDVLICIAPCHLSQSYTCVKNVSVCQTRTSYMAITTSRSPIKCAYSSTLNSCLKCLSCLSTSLLPLSVQMKINMTPPGTPDTSHSRRGGMSRRSTTSFLHLYIMRQSRSSATISPYTLNIGSIIQAPLGPEWIRRSRIVKIRNSYPIIIIILSSLNILTPIAKQDPGFLGKRIIQILVRAGRKIFLATTSFSSFVPFARRPVIQSEGKSLTEVIIAMHSPLSIPRGICKGEFPSVMIV